MIASSTKTSQTTLDWVIECIGKEAAQPLSHAYAGRRLYIPHKAGPDHWLRSTIGDTATDALTGTFGGTHIAFPIGETSGLGLRRKMIAALIRQGKGTTEISRQTGADHRTIQRQRARLARQDDAA